MKPSTAQNWRTFFRWFLGLLLLWAAVSKLANPTDFLGSIYAYRLPLPKELLQFVAVILPWIELLCGLLLITDTWTESALACSLGLLAVFIVATGQAWARRLSISCGCFDLKVFGLHESHPDVVQFVESAGFALVRNLVLAGITFALLKKHLFEMDRATVAVKVAVAAPAPVKLSKRSPSPSGRK